MGLTKRPDSYYVEFRVFDNGKTLTLAQKGCGQLKRWKVRSRNRTAAKQHEAMIQTELMKGLVISDQARPVMFKEWGETYLALEEVKRLRSYKERKHTVTLQLIPFFGRKAISEITAEDVETFRRQRKKRNGKPVKLGTINNDHIILKHCLNIARR